MKNAFCLFLLLAALGCQTLSEDPAHTASEDSLPANNIRHYLARVSADITEGSLQEIRSREDWEQTRATRLGQMRQMLGLLDVPWTGERPPLNVQVTGIVKEAGFHIEKLYYESLPGLYVVANLYVPDQVTGKVPAILYHCGHARTQKVHYQPHARKFAELGFVCLIIETIQYGEVWGEHWGCYARGWFNWYSRGYTPAGVEVWNGIRGLDLLETRKEVDPDRLGVTGISGGGAQAWFMAAVDPRVKAVAPVCGASTIEAQVVTRTVDGHCDCMMINNTFGWSIPEIGALIAPRPLLIAQADRDGLNQIESVREIHAELSGLYDLLGVPGKLTYIETPGGHSYHPSSRKLINAFFMQYLMDRTVSPEEAGDIDESPDAQLSEKELQVYTDAPPADDRTTTIQDSFIKRAGPPVLQDLKEMKAFRDSVTSYLKEYTFHAFPEEPAPFDSTLVFRTLDRAPYGSRIFSYVTEEGWRLKIDVRYNHPPDEQKPLMIVLRNPAEPRWASEGFISGLSDDWNIAYVSLRGVGEVGWPPDLQWHVRRASAWTGRTVASMQVYDLLRTLEFSRILKGVDPDRIGLAARDEMGAIALYAALMDGRCRNVLLKNPPATQDAPGRPDGRDPAMEMLNCLQITDVNQLPALVYPSQVAFIGEVPASYQWSINMADIIGTGNIEVIDDLQGF